MNIQVLGTGCAICKKLHESVIKAVAELNLNINVEYSDDVQDMLALGVMSSPVLVINDKPVVVGQIPSFEKIKQLIADNEAANTSPKEEPVKSSSCGCGSCCCKK